jgi:hypothetical protein
MKKMSTIQLKKKKYPSLFNKLHLNNLNISNDSYHEIIDNYSDTIVKFFEKNREFKEIIPDIKKGKRANFLYKRLVYKGMQLQSPFMKALMKMVKEYEKKNKVEIAKREFTGLYKLSNLDLIKLKLEKLERFKRIKLKDINVKNDEPNSTNNLKRSFSNFSLNMTPKTQKFNLNSSLNDSNYSFNNNKNFSLSNRFSKNSSKINNKELSTYYKSDTNFKNLSLNTFNLFSPKINKAAYLIDKCLDEIDSGNIVSENMNKVSENFSKSIRQKYKTIEFMQKAKILNLDTLGIKKYKKLELNNLNEIKRKLNEKISDTFAYNNRKGFNEQIKNAESTDAIYIYLHNMEKTNRRLENKRNIQRKNIRKIESLCEDEFAKKEYLKKRIDGFNKKHRNEKRIKNFNSYDEFFLTNRKNNEDNNEDDNYNTNGFLPKLLALRKECLKENTVGELFLKKHKLIDEDNEDEDD